MEWKITLSDVCDELYRHQQKKTGKLLSNKQSSREPIFYQRI